MNPAIPVSLYMSALLHVLYNGYCAMVGVSRTGKFSLSKINSIAL